MGHEASSVLILPHFMRVVIRMYYEFPNDYPAEANVLMMLHLRKLNLKD